MDDITTVVGGIMDMNLHHSLLWAFTLVTEDAGCLSLVICGKN